MGDEGGFLHEQGIADLAAALPGCDVQAVSDRQWTDA